MSTAHSQLLKHIKEATKIIYKYQPFHINSCYCYRMLTVLAKEDNQLGNSCIKYWFILNPCSQSKPHSASAPWEWQILLCLNIDLLHTDARPATDAQAAFTILVQKPSARVFTEHWSAHTNEILTCTIVIYPGYTNSVFKILAGTKQGTRPYQFSLQAGETVFFSVSGWAPSILLPRHKAERFQTECYEWRMMTLITNNKLLS